MNRPAGAALRKDLRITRVLWAPMAFSYGVFLLMFMEHVWIYLATGACLTFVAALVAPGIEDRYRSEPLFAALPGTRRSLVLGRYLSWGLITAAGLASFLAFTALFRAAIGPQAARLAPLVSVKGAAAFLAGALLAGLFILPFHFRFGFWRGVWACTAAEFVLSVISLNVIARLVPGVPGEPESAAPLAGFLLWTGRGLRALPRIFDMYLGRPEVLAAEAAAIALLVYFSYRLSVRFYEKRDL